MDCGGFLVKGSRPATVTSNYRPNSAQGKHHGYRTVSRTSFTDESLFGSVHQSKINEPLDQHHKAPWEYPKPITPGHTYSSVRHFKAVLASNKEKPKDPPLLWCPTPESSKFERASKSTKSNASDNGSNWNTKTHFRHLKHTPTFIDESLFGKRLEEPTFEAPWNNNNNSTKREGSVKNSRPYLWDPSGDSRIQCHNGVEITTGNRPSSRSGRPKSALGITRSKVKESSSKPVWKP